MRTLSVLLVLCAFPLAAADISGVWKVEGNISGTDVSPVCTFKQADNKLSGACKLPQAGDAVVTGQLDGNKVTWQYEVDYQDVHYVLVYSGVLDSDTSMKGGFAVGGGESTFIAKKQQARGAEGDAR
jgi:hypothetical protein